MSALVMILEGSEWWLKRSRTSAGSRAGLKTIGRTAKGFVVETPVEEAPVEGGAAAAAVAAAVAAAAAARAC